MTTTECTHEEEDVYTAEDILMLAFVLSAPPSVRAAIVQQIRENISIKAGNSVERLIAGMTEVFPNKAEMFKDIIENLHPELKGPMVDDEQRERPRGGSMIDVLKSIFGDVQVTPLADILKEAPANEAAPGERQFAKPTPGCSCPACTLIIELEAKGIRVDAVTGERVGPHSTN